MEVGREKEQNVFPLEYFNMFLPFHEEDILPPPRNSLPKIHLLLETLLSMASRSVTARLSRSVGWLSSGIPLHSASLFGPWFLKISYSPHSWISSVVAVILGVYFQVITNPAPFIIATCSCFMNEIICWISLIKPTEVNLRFPALLWIISVSSSNSGYCC